MRFKKYGLWILVAGLASAVLTGCATSEKDLAYWNSIDALATHPANSQAPAAPVPAPQMTKEDESAISELVLSYLLERHFWDDGNFSAIFLQADERVESALMKKYSKHQPPIKPAYRSYLPKNQTPVDRDTNKSAMILSLEINEPESDSTVIVIGRWYAGGAVTGFYSFHLKQSDTGWQIIPMNH